MKDKYDHYTLLKHMPSEFRTFLDHISSLDYFDEPDYPLLHSLFDQCLRRKGIHDSDPFDWEKGCGDGSLTTTTTTATPPVGTKETRGMVGYVPFRQGAAVYAWTDAISQIFRKKIFEIFSKFFVGHGIR